MWQDWVNIALGIWMAISPWPLGLDPEQQPHIVYNCVLSGLLIAGFAAWSLATKEKTARLEWVLIFLGMWLLVAPNAWNYESIIMTWDNVLVGLGVLIFATWRVGELVEDRLKW